MENFDVYEKLQERGLLVGLSIGMLGQVSTDKALTDKINNDYLKLDGDVGRYMRVKLTPDVLKKHRMIASQARVRHRLMTCAWMEGVRFLLTEHAMKYTEEMHGLKDDYHAATIELASRWDEIVAEQRLRLGPLFKEEDYPPASELHKHFSFEVSMQPLRSTKLDERMRELLDSLGGDVTELVRQTAEREYKVGLNRAVSDVKDKIRSVAERLIAVCIEDGKMHGSLKEALGSCAVMAWTLAGISDDPELKVLSKWVVDAANSFDLERLRKDKDAKLRYGLEVRDSFPMQLPMEEQKEAA